VNYPFKYDVAELTASYGNKLTMHDSQNLDMKRFRIIFSTE